MIRGIVVEEALVDSGNNPVLDKEVSAAEEVVIPTVVESSLIKEKRLFDIEDSAANKRQKVTDTKTFGKILIK